MNPTRVASSKLAPSTQFMLFRAEYRFRVYSLCSETKGACEKIASCLVFFSIDNQFADSTWLRLLVSSHPTSNSTNLFVSFGLNAVLIGNLPSISFVNMNLIFPWQVDFRWSCLRYRTLAGIVVLYICPYTMKHRLFGAMRM